MNGKKESAGGYDMTTADTNHTSKIIPPLSRTIAQLTHLAGMLATVLRGLA